MAGTFHSKSWDQGFNIQVDPSDWGGIPQGLVRGPELLNIFVGDMDTEIEHFLERFAANSNLSDTTNTLERRDPQA